MRRWWTSPTQAGLPHVAPHPGVPHHHMRMHTKGQRHSYLTVCPASVDLEQLQSAETAPWAAAEMGAADGHATGRLALGPAHLLLLRAGQGALLRPRGPPGATWVPVGGEGALVGALGPACAACLSPDGALTLWRTAEEGPPAAVVALPGFSEVAGPGWMVSLHLGQRPAGDASSQDGAMEAAACLHRVKAAAGNGVESHSFELHCWTVWGGGARPALASAPGWTVARGMYHIGVEPAETGSPGWAATTASMRVRGMVDWLLLLEVVGEGRGAGGRRWAALDVALNVDCALAGATDAER